MVVEVLHSEYTANSDLEFMKILIITQALDQKHPVLGFFVRWVAEFARQCDHVVVICLEKGLYDLPENVTVHSLGKEYRRSRIQYLTRLYRFVVSERKNYDVVFVHMNPEYVILAWLWWWIERKKIGLWYLHKHVGRRLRLAALFTDIIFTASPESFRLTSPKVQVVGHGIDTDFFPFLDREEHETLEVISVGRLSPSKHHGVIIDAVAQVLAHGRKVILTIVGGPALHSDKIYEESLKERVRNLGIERNVRFAGPVPHADLPAYLYAADVFVHPSDTGSLDKTALEAMSSGLPVLSSNDAIVSLLQEFPKLVFKKEDVDSLAEGIEHLLAMDLAERNAIGKTLREKVVKNHSLPHLVEKILFLYAQP